MCIFSPAAPAAVVLRDAVLVLAPDVDGGENERHQHGEAAHQGKDHDALLLRLQGERQRERHIDFRGVVSTFQHSQRGSGGPKVVPTLDLITWPLPAADLVHSSAAAWRIYKGT